MALGALLPTSLTSPIVRLLFLVAAAAAVAAVVSSLPAIMCGVDAAMIGLSGRTTHTYSAGTDAVAGYGSAIGMHYEPFNDTLYIAAAFNVQTIVGMSRDVGVPGWVVVGNRFDTTTFAHVNGHRIQQAVLYRPRSVLPYHNRAGKFISGVRGLIIGTETCVRFVSFINDQVTTASGMCSVSTTGNTNDLDQPPATSRFAGPLYHMSQSPHTGIILVPVANRHVLVELVPWGPDNGVDVQFATRRFSGRVDDTGNSGNVNNNCHDTPTSVAFSPSGRTIVAVERSRVKRITPFHYRSSSNTVSTIITWFQMYAYAACIKMDKFSPMYMYAITRASTDCAGSGCIATDSSDVVELLGTEAVTFGTDNIGECAFTPDGKLWATGYDTAGRLKRYDITPTQAVHHKRGHYVRTLSSSESMSLSNSFNETLSDSLSVSDSASQNRTKSEPLSESESLSGTVTETKTLTVPTPRTPTPSKSSTADSTATFTETYTLTLPPTPTPTPTRTSTATLTMTLPPTPTPTHTSSPSPSETLTETNTSTLPPTPTPTFTATRSETATETETNTSTLPPTKTRTFTATRSESATESETNTSTLPPTLTHLATRSNTSTESWTESRSLTPSATWTQTETATSSASQSGTGTSSASASASATTTATLPLTDTATLEPTDTLSHLDTPTKTATRVPTRSPSITWSNSVNETASSTPTPSSSSSQSASASHSSTFSASGSASASATVSASGSASPSRTVSVTDTGSDTASVTATRTATASPSQTGTVTESESPSLSATSSQSATASVTASPSLSPSRSLSVTDSVSPSDSLTEPATPSHTVPTSSRTATFTESLSASDPSPSFSETGTSLPPEARSRYCELYDDNHRGLYNWQANVMRGNLFDPDAYAPCCSATEVTRERANIPAMSAGGKPTRTLRTCASELRACVRGVGATDSLLATSWVISAWLLQSLPCSAATVACLTSYVTCVIGAAQWVDMSDVTLRCPWHSALVSAATMQVGIPASQRGATFLQRHCVEYLNRALSFPGGPARKCFSSFDVAAECTAALAKLDKHDVAIDEVKKFNLDFTSTAVPSGLDRGVTMRSPFWSCGVCIAPQSATVVSTEGDRGCKCETGGTKYVRTLNTLPPNAAFTNYRESCWSRHAVVDFCHDAANVDAKKVDFFVETARPIGDGAPGSTSAAANRAEATEAPWVAPCNDAHPVTGSCSCPKVENVFKRSFTFPHPRARDGLIERKVVHFCAHVDTNIFIIDQSTGECIQPLLESSEVRGNFSCTCLAGSTSRTIPMAYINSTNNFVSSGLLVLCDQPPVAFNVVGVLSRTITSLAGLIGGPAMALLQAAVITTLIDCDKDQPSENNKQSLLPFTIGSGVISSWLTVAGGMAILVILHTLIALGFTVWRHRKGQELLRLELEVAAALDQEEEELGADAEKRAARRKELLAAALGSGWDASNIHPDVTASSKVARRGANPLAGIPGARSSSERDDDDDDEDDDDSDEDEEDDEDAEALERKFQGHTSAGRSSRLRLTASEFFASSQNQQQQQQQSNAQPQGATELLQRLRRSALEADLDDDGGEGGNGATVVKKPHQQQLRRAGATATTATSNTVPPRRRVAAVVAAAVVDDSDSSAIMTPPATSLAIDVPVTPSTSSVPVPTTPSAATLAQQQNELGGIIDSPAAAASSSLRLHDASVNAPARVEMSSPLYNHLQQIMSPRSGKSGDDPAPLSPANERKQRKRSTTFADDSASAASSTVAASMSASGSLLPHEDLPTRALQHLSLSARSADRSIAARSAAAPGPGDEDVIVVEEVADESGDAAEVKRQQLEKRLAGIFHRAGESVRPSSASDDSSSNNNNNTKNGHDVGAGAVLSKMNKAQTRWRGAAQAARATVRFHDEAQILLRKAEAEQDEPEVEKVAIYRAIPTPAPGESWEDSAKFGVCMARFPYVSMLVGRLAFQGFAYDSVLLMARWSVGSTEGIVGGIGMAICVLWVAAHLYLADHIQKHELWVYRKYNAALAWLPTWLSPKVMPHGFWHNSPFLLAFRAAVDLYVGDSTYLRHLSWTIYMRMVIIGVLAGIKVPKDKCNIIYLTLLVIMWLSAVVFVVFRPHRRPVDDIVNVSLSFLNGLMIIFILRPDLGSSDDVFFVIIVVAMVSMAFTFVFASCEFMWWNKLEVTTAEQAEQAAIEEAIRAREQRLREKREELARIKRLLAELEELALRFTEDELRGRLEVEKEEREQRKRITFATEEDEERHAALHRAASSAFAPLPALLGGGGAESGVFGASAASSSRRKSGAERDDSNAEDLFADGDDGLSSTDGDPALSAQIGSLRAIRRMRLQARRRRQVTVVEQPAMRNSRRGGAPRAALRTNQADADVDMADSFVHRALDVLGFF